MYQETDEAVVVRAIEEKEALAVLIERYEPKLSRYIKRLGVKNEEDTEDVLQNVFVKVYQNLNNFDTSLSFSSWVYRIAHNEAVSFFRHKNVRPEGNAVHDGEEALKLLIDDEALTEKIDETLNAQHVNQALDALDEKYRSALILRFFEERDYKEISDILKVPMGSVATLIHRAKSNLKKELAHII